MEDLFGKKCYIDTPWIAGNKTRYRIIASGTRTNTWCEVPVNGYTKPIWHDHCEEVVFVVLDTLVGDDSTINRFALKDVKVIEQAIPCSDALEIASVNRVSALELKVHVDIDEIKARLKADGWEPVVRGKWVNGAFGYGHYFCSVCQKEVWVGEEKTNFCPNCGADMREVTDSE